jgi:type IV pilus assembly protein PilO
MKNLSDYIDELRSLDGNNIGSWPTWAYTLAISVVAALIAVIASWYFVWPRQSMLAHTRAQESQLKARFKEKQQLVANLDAYRDQLAAMKKQFGALLKQLPSQAEVPSLLRDISQTRAANGLDEELFKPEPEQSKDFYAVLPNDLIVTGDFHQLGQFVSGVAALPRIVTLDNVHIEPVKNGNGTLRMSLTAKTYRYLAEAATAGAGRDIAR